jgi:hypothetical protein
MRYRRAQKNACWSPTLPCFNQRSFSMHHTHTSFLSFTCSTFKARQACKSEAKIMQREHPNVLGPVPEVDVMAKRPQGLLNVGALSARMVVLRSCALA